MKYRYCWHARFNLTKYYTEQAGGGGIPVLDSKFQRRGRFSSTIFLLITDFDLPIYLYCLKCCGRSRYLPSEGSRFDSQILYLQVLLGRSELVSLLNSSSNWVLIPGSFTSLVCSDYPFWTAARVWVAHASTENVMLFNIIQVENGIREYKFIYLLYIICIIEFHLNDSFLKT